MNTLQVQKRNKETKAKRLRREGYVTGNLFGKEFEGSIPIKIEKKEAARIQHECLKGSKLNLDLDGKTYNVLLKEVDFNSMTKQILEMDFQALIKGEKINSVAEIIYHNTDSVIGGILEQLLSEISYRATSEYLIDHIDVDCSTLKLGDAIKVSDLDIAQNKNIEILTHMDAIVANVTAPKNDVLPTDEDEAEATEA